MSTCLNCGGAKGKQLLYGYSGHQLVQCSSCHVVFWPNWSPNFDDSHEADYQSWAHNFIASPTTAKRLDALFGELAKRSLGRKVLDVGCGLGDAVESASRNGWEAMGIDLSATAISICKSRGLNCHQLDFFRLSPDTGTFDLIIMSELIEHVPYPQKWLTHAAELLSPDGRLYLTTPNFNSLGRRILKGEWRAIGRGHIAYFSTKTLSKTAQSGGFRIERISTRNPSIAALRRVFLRRKDEELTHYDQYLQMQRMRELASENRAMRVVKAMVNLLLRATRLGETIVVVMSKP